MKKSLLIAFLILPVMAYGEELSETSKGFHIVKSSNEKTAQTQKTYIETTTRDKYMQFFLNLNKTAPAEIKSFKNSNDLYDTHLKSSVSEIKLSIPFNKLTPINDSEIIGYAAIGSYNNGWTGIRTFFTRSDLGVCSYSFEKFIAISAEKNKISYVVNKKPSFSVIEGNYKVGFIYTLSWDDDKKDSVFDHKLECVNKNMNSEIMTKMIALANQIDNR
jgi:hypothetical protein